MAGLKNIKTGEVFSHSRKTEKIEIERRVNIFCKMLAIGQGRAECIPYAEAEWGVCVATTDNYLRKARAIVRKDWDLDRKDFMAGVMAQLSSLQLEARKKEHYHICLGCLNTQARIAKLIT